MPASIGVNLRVTGHCRQGGRKYMEDFFSVAYQQTEDERDLEYAFFGIYDGHGGAEAAAYAKEHLMKLIVRQKNFWSDNDEDVLKAIKEGYIATHYAMWREQAKWPKTASGLPSTAGTTASIAFIRRGKIYIGHVGDSGIVLGYQDSNSSDWLARPLTKDHKPESAGEIQRIEQCGGKVVSKSGVPRVVWNRPRLGHQGPIRRSTPIDEIPFLAVARSLGDLWSYNSQLDEFVVSPDPDCSVIPIDTNCFRCLIFGTDGLYNMLSPQMAVHIVQQAEKHNENATLSDDPNKIWINPSKCLVEKALERWSTTKMRADNTSVITLLLDPPGPPRAQVLQNRKRKSYPDSGLEIVTRYEGDVPVLPKRSCLENGQSRRIDKNVQVDLCERDSRMLSASEILQKMSAEHVVKNSPILHTIMQEKHSGTPNSTMCEIGTNTDDINKNFVPKAREIADSIKETTEVAKKQSNTDENNVQINEVSSSSNDVEEEHLERKVKNKNRNKCTEVSKRPVLRSRNSKTTTDIKAVAVKNVKQMITRQKEKEKEKSDSETENGDLTRQLRLRPKMDSPKQNQKPDVSSSIPTKQEAGLGTKPSSGNCAKLEWLSASMFRSLIRHKNALKVKKLHQKSRNSFQIRRKGKDGSQMDLRQTKPPDKVEGSPRRSLRQVDLENLKKLRKEEATSIQKRRGRPSISKARARPQSAPRNERLSSMLQNR